MVVDYSQPPKMVHFNGANPLDWVSQVERYFFCCSVSDSVKLRLASFFIEGEAREWFRNNQFRDWDEFVDQLFDRYRNWSREEHDKGSVALEAENFIADHLFAKMPVPTVSSQIHAHKTYATDGGNSATTVDKVFEKKPNSCTDTFQEADATAEVTLQLPLEHGHTNIIPLVESTSVAMELESRDIDAPVRLKNSSTDASIPVAAIQEPHKVCTLLTHVDATYLPNAISNYVAPTNITKDGANVAYEDKNAEEKIVTIGEDILDLVPAVVAAPQPGLRLDHCLEESPCLLSVDSHDQVIVYHISKLGETEILLTLLQFPFDPGTSLFIKLPDAKRNCALLYGLSSLKPDSMMSIHALQGHVNEVFPLLYHGCWDWWLILEVAILVLRFFFIVLDYCSHMLNIQFTHLLVDMISAWDTFIESCATTWLSKTGGMVIFSLNCIYYECFIEPPLLGSTLSKLVDGVHYQRFANLSTSDEFLTFGSRNDPFQCAIFINTLWLQNDFGFHICNWVDTGHRLWHDMNYLLMAWGQPSIPTSCDTLNIGFKTLAYSTFKHSQLWFGFSSSGLVRLTSNDGKHENDAPYCRIPPEPPDHVLVQIDEHNYELPGNGVPSYMYVPAALLIMGAMFQMTNDCLMVFIKMPMRCSVCRIGRIEAYEWAANIEGVLNLFYFILHGYLILGGPWIVLCNANLVTNFNFTCGAYAKFNTFHLLLLVSRCSTRSSASCIRYAIFSTEKGHPVKWPGAKGQLICILKLITLRRLTENQKDHGCNWFIAGVRDPIVFSGHSEYLGMGIFGGERASKIVHPYYKVDNYSFDIFNAYGLYYIASASVQAILVSQRKTLEIIYKQVVQAMSIKGHNDWVYRDKAMSHASFILALSKEAGLFGQESTSPNTLRLCFLMLTFSVLVWIGKQSNHEQQQLATEAMEFLKPGVIVKHTMFSRSLYSNLEDKVLIEDGSNVMNENTFLEGTLGNVGNYLWDPG